MSLRKKICRIVLIMLLVVAAGTNAIADVLVADNSNETLTRYDDNAAIIWQLTTGQRSINQVIVGPDGSIFVSRSGTDNLVDQYTPGGVFIKRFVETTWGKCAYMTFGRDYNGDGIGDLYVSGSSNKRLRIHAGPGSANEGDLLKLVDDPNFIAAEGLAFGPDIGGPGAPNTPDGIEDLYVADGINAEDCRVRVYDGNSLTYLKSIPTDFIRGPRGLAFGPDGRIYIANHHRSTIQVYDANGANEQIFASDGLRNPGGIEFAEDGFLYVANRFSGTRSETSSVGDPNGAILRYDPATGAFADIFIEVIGGYLTSVAYITPVPTPDVLVVDLLNQTLTRYTSGRNIMWQLSDARFRNASDLEIGPDGNIYVGCSGSSDNLVNRYTTDGVFIDRFVASGNKSAGLVFGRDYNGDGIQDLYIAGGAEKKVRVHAGPGSTSPSEGSLIDEVDDSAAGGGPGKIDVANALTFGPDISGDGIADIYVADGWHSTGDVHEMLVYDATDLSLLRNTSMPFIRGAADIAIGPDGRTYVSNHYRSGIESYEPNGSDEQLFTNDGTRNPNGIDFASDGLLYVANRFAGARSELYGLDTTNGAVLRYNAITGAFVDLFIEVAGSNMMDVLTLPRDPDYDYCPNSTAADINEDCVVDWLDLQLMVADWLKCTDPNTANCP